MDYGRLPEHVQDGMKLYIEEGISPGSFLTAVLENDLMMAFGMAGHINRERLFDFCQFLYNEAPEKCHGSREKVANWIKMFDDARSKKEDDGGVKI